MGLATERMFTLQALESALASQLYFVDVLLPEPWFFGRKHWRKTRDAARYQLQSEHACVWVAANHADTLEQLREAVESSGMTSGPRVTAQAAINAARAELPRAEVRR